MDVLTQAAQNYTDTFSSYINLFVGWGKLVFFSLATINVAWLALWYAFDRQSLSESMPDFIKRFFIISLFYTLMVNPSWLFDLLKTSQVMGSTLTHAGIDPSSMISNGIAIGNKIIVPIAKSSLLSMGFGLIIVSIVYLVVLFVHISIALELALTLIITTALISVSAFFLGFAAIESTSNIARQTLDVILANCVKLLGIYLVVAAGNKTMTHVAASIPNKIESLDPYAWIVAVAVLFWLVAKNLPNQLARIVSGTFQAPHGTEAGAMAMSAIRAVSLVQPALSLAGRAATQGATLAGSTLNNAAAHFQKASMSGGVVGGIGAAIGGSMGSLGKSMTGNLSDHFKNISNKLAGGPGTHQKVNTISERMYQQADHLKHSMSPNSSNEGGLSQAPTTMQNRSRLPQKETHDEGK